MMPKAMGVFCISSGQIQQASSSLIQIQKVFLEENMKEYILS